MRGDILYYAPRTIERTAGSNYNKSVYDCQKEIMKKQPGVQRVDKPWGYEIIYAWTEKYVGKVLFVKKGHRLSLQFHREKDETIFIYQGKIELQVGEKEDKLSTRILPAGTAVRLKPLMLHRMKALADTHILEVSTPQITDVVRLMDDYGRV